MDDNVPVRVNSSSSTAHRSSGRKKIMKKSKRGLLGIVVSGIFVVAFFVGGWLLSQTSAALHISNDKYQAVFLTNGQVYFGKLRKLNSNYFRLSDIFYLQTDDSDSKSVQKASDGSDANIKLVKLGNEVHGPEDEMIIDKIQILFFENLKKDGTVTRSIATYYSDS